VSDFQTGDMVVLISGSMRMTVEEVDGGLVKVVWCHEGRIGRDAFEAKLLNKWEMREDKGHSGRPQGDRKPWGDKGDRGDRGGPKPWQGKGDRDERRDDRRDDRRDGPPRKTGWDGKPRDKKYFRKDD
jgi:uncharacterized protein YodC (DUF2158 family)